MHGVVTYCHNWHTMTLQSQVAVLPTTLQPDHRGGAGSKGACYNMVWFGACSWTNIFGWNILTNICIFIICIIVYFQKFSFTKEELRQTQVECQKIETSSNLNQNSLHSLLDTKVRIKVQIVSLRSHLRLHQHDMMMWPIIFARIIAHILNTFTIFWGRN
jgi:hypothetical protein